MSPFAIPRFRRLAETPEPPFDLQISTPDGDSGRCIRESRRDSPTWARRRKSIAFKLNCTANSEAIADGRPS